MLYLNLSRYTTGEIKWNLTLTSVVFELTNDENSIWRCAYLTLTSVVFELLPSMIGSKMMKYLTLTSVVFEWYRLHLW